MSTNESELIGIVYEILDDMGFSDDPVAREQFMISLRAQLCF